MRNTKLSIFSLSSILVVILFNEISAQAVCVEGEFRFHWHNQYIQDMDKGYACEYSMPDTITIVDHNGDPVSAHVTWTNATVINGSPGWNNKAIVQSTDFGSADTIIVTANFDFPINEPHSMELKLAKVEFLYLDKYLGLSIFAMDSNLISDYSTYFTGPITSLPYKFLLPSVLDAIRAITKPKQGFYSPYYNSTSSALAFYPRRFDVDSDTLSIDYEAILVNDTLTTFVFGCSTDPEAVVFLGNPIFKTVTFIFLCDTSGLCPPPIDLLKVVTEANNILNTAGLFISIDTVFWDTTGWDINHDGVFSTDEQKILHALYKITDDSVKWKSDYLVWIVPNLGINDKGQRVAGRATTLYVKSMALDAIDYSSGSTLAHEIGHACFGFMHPIDMEPSINDTNNFMFENDLRKDNIRAYQFISIHSIR